jgi:hypothetical protein
MDLGQVRPPEPDRCPGVPGPAINKKKNASKNFFDFTGFFFREVRVSWILLWLGRKSEAEVVVKYMRLFFGCGELLNQKEKGRRKRRKEGGKLG